MLSIFIDLIVVGLIAFFVFLGYKKGLVLTVYNFFSFIISIILANMLYPHVARFISSNTGLYDFIRDKAAANITANINSKVDEAGSSIADAAKSLNFPSFITKAAERHYPETVNTNEILGVNAIGNYFGDAFASIAINIISMLLVFVIVFIGVCIVGKLLKIISHLPIIKTFNSIGGLAIGFLQGILIIWLLLTVGILYATFNGDTAILNALNKSCITKTVQDYNIIFNLIKNIL